MALRSVTIPVTVTEIPENAFEGSGIREVIYGGTQAEWNERFADLSNIVKSNHDLWCAKAEKYLLENFE